MPRGMPPRRAPARRRGDQPPAVGLVTDQRGEERGGVEPGRAHPVDRPVVSDQGRGLGVTDERVLLDARGHASRDATCPTLPSSLLHLHERHPQLTQRVAQRLLVRPQPGPQPLHDRGEGVDATAASSRRGASTLLGHEVQHRQLPEPDGVVRDQVHDRGRRQLGPDPAHLGGQRRLVGRAPAAPARRPPRRTGCPSPPGSGSSGTCSPEGVHKPLTLISSLPNNRCGKWDDLPPPARLAEDRPHPAGTRTHGPYRVRVRPSSRGVSPRPWWWRMLPASATVRVRQPSEVMS